MKKLTSWSNNAVRKMQDPNMTDIYESGAIEMRDRIYKMLIEEDLLNSENIKNDPRLASYLLLQLAEKVKNLGEDEV